MYDSFRIQFTIVLLLSILFVHPANLGEALLGIVGIAGAVVFWTGIEYTIVGPGLKRRALALAISFAGLVAAAIIYRHFMYPDKPLF